MFQKNCAFKKEVSPYENQMRYFREVSENCIDKKRIWVNFGSF
jgi:hypothetical protein